MTLLRRWINSLQLRPGATAVASNDKLCEAMRDGVLLCRLLERLS